MYLQGMRFVVFTLCWLLLPYLAHAASLALAEIDGEILAVAYRGGERLDYDVSWTGGLKIGELHLEMNRVAWASGERYELRARVKDSGLFHFFYPVDDSFITVVEGQQRLPVSYHVHQKEGSSYEATRKTEYHQLTGSIRYQKNEQPWQQYQVEGVTHNEFSSFFLTRVLHLDPERPVIVPTFADGKRHEVVVHTGETTRISGTLLGDVNVIPVVPVMKFKGLYDKNGDTVIWFTDDLCRVPVRINSKILIGSLTAELTSYDNPFCPEQSRQQRKLPESVQHARALDLGD